MTNMQTESDTIIWEQRCRELEIENRNLRKRSRAAIAMLLLKSPNGLVEAIPACTRFDVVAVLEGRA